MPLRGNIYDFDLHGAAGGNQLHPFLIGPAYLNLEKARIEDARDLGAAADQAEIPQIARAERTQRFEVVRVAPRDDDDVGRWRQVGAVKPAADVIDDDAVGEWKPLVARELLAIVHDVDAEAGVGGRAREVEADVARADDVERWRRGDRIDVDLHLAAADEPRLLDEVVVQIVLDQRGCAGGDRLSRPAKRIGLVAAAADGTHGPAVGIHEHLRAGALRRGAAGPHDRDECGGFAAFERGRRRRKDGVVQIRTSIFDFFFKASMNASACCCFFCSPRYCLICALASSNGTTRPGLWSVTLMM